MSRCGNLGSCGRRWGEPSQLPPDWPQDMGWTVNGMSRTMGLMAPKAQCCELRSPDGCSVTRTGPAVSPSGHQRGSSHGGPRITFQVPSTTEPSDHQLGVPHGWSMTASEVPSMAPSSSMALMTLLGLAALIAGHLGSLDTLFMRLSPSWAVPALAQTRWSFLLAQPSVVPGLSPACSSLHTARDPGCCILLRCDTVAWRALALSRCAYRDHPVQTALLS